MNAKFIVFIIATVFTFAPLAAQADSDVYMGFPVTVPGYSGDKTDSTSYTGQIARYVLHDSLKKLAGKGNGESNDDLKAQMLSYYSSTDADRAIIAPKSKEGFPVKQTNVDEISKGKQLRDKVYKGGVPSWPGYMSAPEVLDFMIDKAAATEKGFDPVTGYDYPQLISKFMIGALFYNQAVDKYLDESLSLDKYPNNQPYKEGKHYTGKEHVWDEGFGYFGAPAHALSLDPNQTYGIAKGKADVMAVADHNQDGVIDLKSEMTFANAYYAADADKSGKSNYLHGITQAFIDGRKLIASANGNALTSEQHAELIAIADSIKMQWQQVLAEAAFKYAGSVYKDLQKLNTIIEADGDVSKAFRAYGKHWGELKGFSMALQTSGVDLGETAVEMNRLIGFSPVHLGGSQVVNIGSDGSYQIGETISMGDYMVNMGKLQNLLGERFALTSRKNDVTGELHDLIHSLGESQSAETD